jgi:protein-S-isoprenylcysteine O-methyltransferase Ste14
VSRLDGLELKIPPVAVGLLIAGLMGLAAWRLPGLTSPIPGRATVAAGLVAAGAVVAVLGIVAFRRVRTTVNPMSPESASTLVIFGIYRRTRNPMYLGMLLILLALAVFLSNALAALLVPVFVLYMTRFQILPEERALEARFGAAFVAYKRQVRRWL